MSGLIDSAYLVVMLRFIPLSPICSFGHKANTPLSVVAISTACKLHEAPWTGKAHWGRTANVDTLESQMGGALLDAIGCGFRHGIRGQSSPAGCWGAATQRAFLTWQLR